MARAISKKKKKKAYELFFYYLQDVHNFWLIIIFCLPQNAVLEKWLEIL